jgi:hypothetical protein
MQRKLDFLVQICEWCSKWGQFKILEVWVSEYAAIYEAIRNAELLLHLRQRFVDGFHYESSKAMYDA